VLCRAQASRPASLRSRVLVAAASSVAVAVFAAVAIPTATCLLARRIATLLLRWAAFNPARLLWTGLALGPLEVARGVIPADLPFSPSLSGAVFNPAHLLLTTLAPSAIERVLLAVAIYGPPVHSLDGRTVLPPLPIGLCGTLMAE
jgi:hypothetical protein